MKKLLFIGVLFASIHCFAPMYGGGLSTQMRMCVRDHLIKDLHTLLESELKFDHEQISWFTDELFKRSAFSIEAQNSTVPTHIYLQPETNHALCFTDGLLISVALESLSNAMRCNVLQPVVLERTYPLPEPNIVLPPKVVVTCASILSWQRNRPDNIDLLDQEIIAAHLIENPDPDIHRDGWLSPFYFNVVENDDQDADKKKELDPFRFTLDDLKK